MRVSAKVDYAVRAAVELAAAESPPVKGELISQAQDIPLKFLENILGELSTPASSEPAWHRGRLLARPPAGGSLDRGHHPGRRGAARERPGSLPGGAQLQRHRGAARQAVGRRAGQPARCARGGHARGHRDRRPTRRDRRDHQRPRAPGSPTEASSFRGRPRPAVQRARWNPGHWAKDLDAGNGHDGDMEQAAPRRVTRNNRERRLGTASWTERCAGDSSRRRTCRRTSGVSHDWSGRLASKKGNRTSSPLTQEPAVPALGSAGGLGRRHIRRWIRWGLRGSPARADDAAAQHADHALNNVNFLLYTPFLPEAAAGTLEPRHVVTPLRDVLKHTACASVR